MTEKKKTPSLPTCGIIMPISLIDNCPPEHWAEVLSIIKEVCDINGFNPNLVSDADDAGIIHNRIVENIYSSDIVICDVSCKNANVMFELGMRLAFDKPTIIIKDDLTGYSFDTSMIEHVEYRRDLRFTSINKFKEILGNKLKATYEKSQTDTSYSPFLKNFGKYKIAHLEDREITSDTYILNAIQDIQRDIRIFKNVAVYENEDRYKARASKANRINNIVTKTMGANATTLFRNAVQNYLKNNNISCSPEETEMILPEIIDDLKQDIGLMHIAGDYSNFENLVRHAIYSR